MTWNRPDPPRVSPERVPWFLLVGATVVLAILIVGSAANYTSITQAHANAYFTPAYSLSIQGADPKGVLSPNGSIRLWLNLTAENPSPRVLDFQSIVLKAWIGNATFTWGHYPVFLSTFDVNTLPVPPPPIPSYGNRTLRLNFTLTRAMDLTTFDAVRHIQGEVANATGTATHIPWSEFVLITLRIEGVPDPSPTSATYELNVNRVILQWGEDLGT